MVNPDFILLARSMGVHAIRCNNADELPEKMKTFLEFDGSRPVLMECLVERNEHVFPMVSIFVYSFFHAPVVHNGIVQVAAGKALHEFIVHPSLTEKLKRKA